MKNFIFELHIDYIQKQYFEKGSITTTIVVATSRFLKSLQPKIQLYLSIIFHNIMDYDITVTMVI